ncbi:hypothetical protein A2U01_0088748, partial [Trifolium medium]|nr:hypothetical protein [Trifolium medium]
MFSQVVLIPRVLIRGQVHDLERVKEFNYTLDQD